MSLAAFSAFLLLLLQTPTARIEGRVLDGDSGQPLSAVEVALWRFSSGQQITTVSTDAQGRFTFPNLAASDYRVSVRKSGYAENGPFIPSGAGVSMGTPVIFQPNETLRSLELKLSRESLIAGRVLTSEGEPAADVEVQLVSESFDATGRKTHGLTSAGGTNDRGEYRLTGAFSGRYYIRAGVSEILRSTGQIAQPEDSLAASYVTTFYPSADSVSQATRVDLWTPTERTSVDIVLKRRPTTKYRISGQLFDGRPAAARRGSIQYSFTPKDSDGRAVTRAYTPGVDGIFEIAGVEPGEYILTAQIQDPVARPPAGVAPVGFHTLYASVPIQIAGSDVPDVRVTIAPVSLRGRLRMDDGTAPKDGWQVRLRKYNGNSPVPAPIGADGAFTLEDLGIGNEYALSVSGLEPDMFIKDARLNTTDLRYQLLPITSATPLPLDIVIGTKGGRIEGITQKAGATVAIIPAERYRNDLYRSAVTDLQGRFSVRGIPPGEYKVFAWEKLPQRYIFFDPAFLGQFESAGKTVTISEESSETLHLTAIPQ